MPDSENTNNRIAPETVPGMGHSDQGPGTIESAEAVPGAVPPESHPPVSRPTMPGTPLPAKGALPGWLRRIWIVLAALVLLLVAILALFTSRRPGLGEPKKEPGQAARVQEGGDLSNYSAFVAQNQALLRRNSAETVLTDDEFAGQAPRATRGSGPLLSAEDDPRLAALVDAFRIRVQVMQGSQAFVRNQALTRVTKGDLRGFKVQASERVENGRIVAEDAQLQTPRNGVIRTVGRVLAGVQKTDLAGVLAEVNEAGMEFLPLPAATDGRSLRVQLRFTRSWGKEVAAERMIDGGGVGGLAVGMPISRMREILPAVFGVLKRKVLVNDAYYDVYKIMEPDGEPLFFVYEKEGRVWGISIISASFRTRLGIGINSTLDQVRIHYPQVRLAHSGKGIPFVRVGGVDGNFVIENEGDKRVISILIGESPEFE